SSQSARISHRPSSCGSRTTASSSTSRSVMGMGPPAGWALSARRVTCPLTAGPIVAVSRKGRWLGFPFLVPSDPRELAQVGSVRGFPGKRNYSMSITVAILLGILPPTVAGQAEQLAALEHPSATVRLRAAATFQQAGSVSPAVVQALSLAALDGDRE